MPKTPFQKVWEFHTAFGQVRNIIPTLPGSETLADPNSLRSLRKRLLEEEYNEYVTGEDNNDLVEIADAIADILYIAYGTAVSYGLPMDEIFDEVHASNMSKLGDDGKPIYREDGKILKGPEFFKPDIAAIIERSANVNAFRTIDEADAEILGADDAHYCEVEADGKAYTGSSNWDIQDRFAVYIGTASLPHDHAMRVYEGIKADFLAQVKASGDPAIYYFLRSPAQEGTKIERI